MSETTSIPFFSPQWADPKDLEKILVQREGLLHESVSLLRDSVLTDSKHHLLFIGSRGSGKSHLVTLIQHRLGKDKTLRKKMRVAWLNEDETATSFLRLLVLIYRALSERYPEEFSKDTISNLMGTEPATARDQLERRIVADLEGKVAVVIMENLDSLFHHLPEKEQLSWRAFLQNHPIFTTVGTAQALFKEVSDRDNPFFGFFDTRHLKPLTVDEARSLLEKIARHNVRPDLLEYLQTSAGRSRVVAIRALAGGNPRLYVIFSELLTKAADLDDLVRPFEEMVEQQLTSYYQERLRWLSPQQREIIQLLSRNRHPLTVKKIAEGLFTTHNSITGQLKQLRAMGYLSSKQRGREVFYELTEPLMRLALQVKETHDRKPLTLIVDFLRVWYEHDELDAQLLTCDLESRVRAYYLEAKAAIEAGEPSLRQEYLRMQIEGIDLEHCTDEDLKYLRAAAEDSNEPADWLCVGAAAFWQNEFPLTISALTRVRNHPKSTAEQVAKAGIYSGLAHRHAGRADQAIAEFTEVIERDSTPGEELAGALFNRGWCHFRANDSESAVADYTRVAEMTRAPVDVIVKALQVLAATHREAGNLDRAIAIHSRIIGIDGARADDIAMALNDRGTIYLKRECMKQAIGDYTRVIELNGAPADQVAKALNNRGFVHCLAKNHREAIADHSRVIALSGAPAVQIANALNGRGAAYGESGDLEAALADFNQVLKLLDVPIIEVAKAFHNLGLSHHKNKCIDAAIEEYTKVIEMPEAPTELVIKAHTNRGFAAHAVGDHQLGLESFRKLLEIPKAADIEQTLIPSRLAAVSYVVVDLIFSESSDPKRWLGRISTFLQRFAHRAALPSLGEALVKQLPKVGESALNHAAWDAWVEAWTDEGDKLKPEDREQLDIPLRLLRTGIAYLKSEDEGELLALHAEERAILREALNLPPETVA